ncbi:MAG: diguanylate cyclase [Cyanobacteriota bacterium]
MLEKLQLKKIFKAIDIQKVKIISLSGLIIITFLMCYLTFLKAFLTSWELAAYDLRFKIRQQLNFEAEGSSDIGIIAFSNKDNTFIREHPEIGLGRWPLPRMVWKDINNYLIRANADAIVYDIMFQNKTDDLNDSIFASSINDSKIIYLPFLSIPLSINSIKSTTLPYNKYNIYSYAEVLNSYLITKEQLSSDVTKKNTKEIKKFSLKIDTNKISINLLSEIFYSLNLLNLPLEEFLKNAKGIGLINKPYESGNITRESIAFGIFNRDIVLPGLSLTPIADLLPPDKTVLSIDKNNLMFADKKIPLHNEGAFYIDWRTPFTYDTVDFTAAYLYEKYYTIDKQTGFKILPKKQNYFLNSFEEQFYFNIKDSINSHVLILNNYSWLFFLNYPVATDEFFYFNNYFGNSYSNDVSYLSIIEKYSKFTRFDVYSLIPLKGYFIEPINLNFSNIAFENDQLSIMTSIVIDKYHRYVKSPSMFTSKIVLIGESTATGDIHSTPLKNTYPGVTILANSMDNLLNDNTFFRKSSLWVDILCYIILIILSITILKIVKNNLLSFITFINLLISFITFNLLLFICFKIILPLVSPLVIVTLFFIFSIITQNFLTKEALKKTYKLATTDGLTGLYNHRYFQEKMSSKILDPKRKEDRFSLLLIDIDFFKKFNDTYGHRAGDAVLIQVGKTLHNCVRNYDIVCRYGGEEMCIILDKTLTEEALDIAHKIVKKVSESDFYIDDGVKKVNVTISIGVANFPENAQTVPELIEFADQGLYRAKEGGRNRVGELEDVFNSEIKHTVSKELEIAKAKVLKELEKIQQICHEKGFIYNEIIDELCNQATINDNNDSQN